MLKFKPFKQGFAPQAMWINTLLIAGLAVSIGLFGVPVAQAVASTGPEIEIRPPGELTEGLETVERLAGSSWQVVELRGRPVLSVQALTLTFEEPGRLSGHSGCNAYAASYVQQQSQLYVADVRQTLRECTSAVAAQNEREFLRILEGSREARRDAEGNLVIFSTQGTFQAVEIR